MSVTVRTTRGLYSQRNHFPKLGQVFECATTLAMYSTVNNATKLVSRPNQTLPETACDDGIVSSTVTAADIMMRAVVATCIKNADGEDVGCSSRRYRSRFQRGWMPLAAASAFSNVTTCCIASKRGDDALFPVDLKFEGPVRDRGIESFMWSVTVYSVN